MTDAELASESVPVENVPEVVADVPDGTEAAKEVVADPTPAPEAGEIPAKKQEGFSKRIDELTRDFYGEKRARERAESDARALREQIEALKPKPVAVNSAPPKLEDFGFDEEKFRAADREYNRAEAVNAARETLREEREKQQSQARAATFAERETAYKAKNPDYQKKVYSDNVPISDATYGLILESEVGPQVAEYLADHLDVANQIYRMDPMAMAKEIGRIEAKLEKPPTAPVVVPRVSQAPPPPPKIEAKDAAPPKQIDDPKITDAEFARIRRNQIAQRR